MFTALRNASAGPSRLPLSARPLLSSRVPINPLRNAGPIQPQQQLSAASISIQARAFSGSAPAGDKLKSHSGTKKRFFRTGGGLFKRLTYKGQAGKRHLNTLFSPGRINRLGRTAYASITQSKMLKKLLPYA